MSIGRETVTKGGTDRSRLCRSEEGTETEQTAVDVEQPFGFARAGAPRAAFGWSTHESHASYTAG